MVGGEPVDFFTSVAENLNSALPRTKLIMQLAVIQNKEPSSQKLKQFGTQDFTDPGLLKIWPTLTGLSLWFCLHKYLLVASPTPQLLGHATSSSKGAFLWNDPEQDQ